MALGRPSQEKPILELFVSGKNPPLGRQWLSGAWQEWAQLIAVHKAGLCNLLFYLTG